MINNFGSNLTDLLIHTLFNVKQHGILSVMFNIPQDQISIVDSEGTLVLQPNQYADPNQDGISHYNYVNSSEANDDDGLDFNASYSQKIQKKKKFKEISPVAIKVGKDLHILLNIFSKLPQSPPMRDKTVFSKKEYYRKALLEHLKMIHQNDQEFQFFRGTKRVELYQTNGDSLESDTKVSIKVQEGDDFTDNFKDIATKLAENIYRSVTGEVNEQISKEMSRRKELRLHVEMFKAYTRLQAFCALNLSRGQGETTKSQSKALVVKYFPHILLQDMNLMLQRAPRIYRLLLLSDGDWRFVEAFEELSSCFFKSSMNSASNFEIWLNLVKTGEMANYEEGSTMRERGRQCMKQAKLEIIKSYFDGVNEDLKDFIIDDDEE